MEWPPYLTSESWSCLSDHKEHKIDNMKFNISIYDKLQVKTLHFHLMSTDSNFIDILLKNYWFENRSFCIMPEGIIGKFLSPTSLPQALYH